MKGRLSIPQQTGRTAKSQMGKDPRRQYSISAEFSELAIASIPLPLLITQFGETEHRILSANPAFYRVTGYEEREVVGRDPLSLFAKSVSLKHSMSHPLDQPYFSEEILTRKDGATLRVELAVSPIKKTGTTAHAVWLIHDISHHKSAETDSRHSLQLESLGGFVAGIAHEFSNLLTGIMIYCGLLSQALPPASRLQRHTDQIMGTAEKGAMLVSQILALPHRPKIDVKPTNLNAVVSGMRQVLQRLLGEDVVLETACASDLRLAKADLGLIEAVLFNLASNARDAMPQGGKLMIRTFNAEVTDEPAQSQPGLEVGSYAVLSVVDTGVGMLPDVQQRIFEPFFTTKTNGSGLGLAMAQNAIRERGGHIYVESRPGAGTTFFIYLPAYEESRPGAKGGQLNL